VLLQNAFFDQKSGIKIRLNELHLKVTNSA